MLNNIWPNIFTVEGHKNLGILLRQQIITQNYCEILIEVIAEIQSKH